MSYSHSFVGYHPPPRFNGLPWLSVRIAAAATSTGPFTPFDTIALSPLDTDPTHPQARSVTTDLAPLESGYFTLTFLGAGGVESSPSSPVLSPARYGSVPSAAEVRAWSSVDFAEFGYPAPTPPDPDPLQVFVDRAIGDVERDTGLVVADVNVDGTDLNTELLVGEAIQMLTEWKVGSSQPEVLESAYDYDMISSFSAGSYSETRRGAGSGANLLHPWPRLAHLLFILSGGADGMEVPVVGAEDPDWERQRYIIDAQRRRIGPFGPMTQPWDGNPWI